ncbi:hypothetical protein [Bradyrhizobium sp. ORS 375]|uniref:hypothetical protein n=1 Tax=Bradyrhizobium sp. (strain ORS 375) TaxID=566679 RepID=UPI001585733A|nr:hypothetical protein [Bradyrhizobium sp. ORS 375]
MRQADVAYRIPIVQFGVENLANAGESVRHNTMTAKRYCKNAPDIHPYQLDDILAAADWTLVDAILREIDAVSKEIVYAMG